MEFRTEFGKILLTTLLLLLPTSLTVLWKAHTVPDLWKLADITPLPKESNFKNCTQLRPISPTNVIMRVFERLVYRQEQSQCVNNFIDLDQFAYRKGHNTTMALIKVIPQKLNSPMIFFEVFPESSLLSTVSRNTIKKIGHHSRLRDMMGQSCPIYACTSAYHAHNLSVHVTFCGSSKHTLLK